MSAYPRIVMSFSNMSSAFTEDIQNMLFYTFFSKPQNWKKTFLIKVFYQILQLLFSLFIVFKRWYVISRPCVNYGSPDGFPPEKITGRMKSINLSYVYITQISIYCFWQVKYTSVQFTHAESKMETKQFPFTSRRVLSWK